ncbi:MAG: 3-hydroxybutyryl-CoA dehydrogenase [Phycisphaerales bacterium]|nr:3-hydroxybutyryl-CoA dehydrogenase [Phycisphaerales bacterium]MCB9836790.1 3-hydroxybutyryl-CoA dehydrogenase [Phycisphaera sp.]
MSQIKRVGVVGSGQMGGGIAQVAAVSGFETVVMDTSAEAVARCEANHDKLLARAVEKGKMTEDDVKAAKSRLTYVTDVKDLGQSDIVIEAVVENAEVKKAIFKQLAAMFTGDQILASNTSSISITEIAAATDCPERVIGMHFFFPVPVMKLVEVINGLATDSKVTERVIALAEAMGKIALPANDRAGFISNRVLMPMINEAFYAWMEGVAEPKDIDGIMKLGCNHPMGPLELADFIGLDTCAHIMNVLAEGLHSERYRPCPKLDQLVVAGRMGRKSGRGVYEY